MPDLLLASTNSNTGDHDILFENKDFQVTKTEDESLAQRLTVKLRTFMGDWFLDSSVGIPYIESILGKNRSLIAIQAIFQNAIASEEEVLQLISLTTDLDKVNRILTVTFKVKSASSAETIPIELSI